jgi:hypothetical protein
MSVQDESTSAGPGPSFRLSISAEPRLVEMVRDLAVRIAEQRSYPSGQAEAIGRGVALVVEEMRRASSGARAIDVHFFTRDAALRIDLAADGPAAGAESLERRLEGLPDDGPALARLRATFASVSFSAQAGTESCRLACMPAGARH